MSSHKIHTNYGKKVTIFLDKMDETFVPKYCVQDRQPGQQTNVAQKSDDKKLM